MLLEMTYETTVGATDLYDHVHFPVPVEFVLYLVSMVLHRRECMVRFVGVDSILAVPSFSSLSPMGSPLLALLSPDSASCNAFPSELLLSSFFIGGILFFSRGEVSSEFDFLSILVLTWAVAFSCISAVLFG